jgi:hypothetical protein
VAFSLYSKIGALLRFIPGAVEQLLTVVYAPSMVDNVAFAATIALDEVYST